MKLTVSMRSLASALRQLGRVARKSDAKVTKLSIVAHRPGMAMLSASDAKSGVWMSVWIPVEQHQPWVGEIALPSEQMAAIIATAQTPDLELAHDENGTRITSASAEWNLSPIDLSAVHGSPDTGGRKTLFSCEPEVLARGIASVEHSVASETARFTMTGLLVESSKSGVRFVCTDSRRLAIRTINCVPGSHGDVLLPRQAIQSMTFDGATKVEVQASRNHVTVNWFKDELPVAMLTAALLEGKFPAYREVLPKEPAHGCVHQIESVVSAIKQVACVSELNRVDVEYQPGKVVFSSSSSYGKAQVEVACEHAISAKFAANSQYLLEALAAVEGQTATISLSKQPSVIIESQDLFQLVMPLS